MKYSELIEEVLEHEELEKEAGLGSALGKAAWRTGDLALTATGGVARGMGRIARKKGALGTLGLVSGGMHAIGGIKSAAKEITRPGDMMLNHVGFSKGVQSLDPNRAPKVADMYSDDIEKIAGPFMDEVKNVIKDGAKNLSPHYKLVSGIISRAKQSAGKGRMHRKVTEAVKEVGEKSSIHKKQYVDKLRDTHSDDEINSIKDALGIKEGGRNNVYRPNNNGGNKNSGNGGGGRAEKSLPRRMAENALVGLAGSAGLAAGGGIVHAIADKHLKGSKGNEQLRKKLQDDYNNRKVYNAITGDNNNNHRPNFNNKPNYNKPSYNNDRSNYNNNYSNNREFHKRAGIEGVEPSGSFMGDLIETLSPATKKKGLLAKKNKASKVKEIIREDIVRGAINSVPYAVAPAAVMGMLGRDRVTFKKKDKDNIKRTIVDIPEDSLNKTAAIKKQTLLQKLKKDYIPKDIGEGIARNAIRGVVYTLPVAAVAGLTGRNLRGGLEKFDNSNKEIKPVQKGKVRVIVERNE